MADKAPAERKATIRDEIRSVLRRGWATALQISSIVGISEEAVPGHLEHLEKSAKAAGERFEIEPPVCNACDFVFEERGRYTRPSRCPECRGERIDPPRFRLVAKP